ncbi:mediator of RNA polymerase II transcription [Colletotrichum tofieldiae]|nr:mediator of RNA polymerase II transcription [Colletotrichum tofieldiae]GKT73117.1 mediator of RNA polymerase II transcription [Colletotrichum tofieldiae]GKT88215.1 mediator of RNA polymerase II transcription [Colletotrichum tofieldiae]
MAPRASVPFTCTFCYQPSDDPPHVVGHEARLTCSPCHAALIDLAICWVCGEIVYRGDECVSLG